jgi:hypothetical protein
MLRTVMLSLTPGIPGRKQQKPRTIGYGFPGSPDLDNRQIQEATLVAQWRIVKTENRGSVQFASQFSWLQRTLFSPVKGPFGPLVSDQPYLVFSQIRYNLP